MRILTEMADRKFLPDPLIRFGIRRLDKKRLLDERRRHMAGQQNPNEKLIADMHQSPIAIQPHKANEQHYEMPPEFFRYVLGRHLKYSGSYWPPGVKDLDQAEATMLAITSQRAELTDGLHILELGCGWGSLSLWMAQMTSTGMTTKAPKSPTKVNISIPILPKR